MHKKRKEANPITLKVFDKMPSLEAWLIKIVFDLNIVQVCFRLCLSVYMLQIYFVSKLFDYLITIRFNCKETKVEFFWILRGNYSSRLCRP